MIRYCMYDSPVGPLLLAADGAIGIGSDSHISVSPVEELRWLEYGQRLATHHRNIAAGPRFDSVGETLLHGTLASGANATGHAVGVFDVGACADWVLLDREAPQFAGATAHDAIDRWLFSGNRNLVREVHVGGVRVVREGRHRDREGIAARYREAMGKLLAG